MMSEQVTAVLECWGLMNLIDTKLPQQCWFVNSPEEIWPLSQQEGWGWLVIKENSMAEKRRGAVTAAGNEDVGGLRRKGEISGRAGRKNEDD